MIARLWFGRAEWLFSFKCFAAAMLAYYIALRIGLTRPYWAVTTSYIIAQPLAGAVLSKALFRVIGTVTGAAAAVLLVPTLVNAPELLCLALALWLALCVYVAMLDRTPRSYIFLLAGYTAAIIGIPSVTAADAIFTTASLRVQEIVLGILCSSLVHGLVLPQSVTQRLLARVDAMLLDAERWSRAALATPGDSALDRDRRRLALDVSELHQLAVHLPFDPVRSRPRVRTLRALRDELAMLLPLASAVDDRLSELRRGGYAPSPLVAALLADVDGWLADPPPLPDRGRSAEALIARARALEPAFASPPGWRDALRLSMLARLAELIAAHSHCRDLRDQMRSPGNAPVSPAIAGLLARRSGRAVHLDPGLALRAALATAAVVLIGCAIWIGTAWAEGGGAVLIAAIYCALFSGLEEPASVLVPLFRASLVAYGITAVYAFAVLPAVTDFVTLVLVVSPVFLAMGLMMARPAFALAGTGFLLTLPNAIGLNDRYGGGFDTFANGAIAQLFGTLLAIVNVRLFQTIGAEASARRLLRAGWRDIAARADAAGRPDVARWVGRMVDRIGLLAARLGAAGVPDPGAPMFDALVDLRVGVALGELRQVRVDGDGAEGALITPVLQGVARHYRALTASAEPAREAELLAGIDRAIDRLAAGAGPRRRDAVLALTSLRRNMFPHAAGLGQAA